MEAEIVDWMGSLDQILTLAEPKGILDLDVEIQRWGEEQRSLRLVYWIASLNNTNRITGENVLIFKQFAGRVNRSRRQCPIWSKRGQKRPEGSGQRGLRVIRNILISSSFGVSTTCISITKMLQT